MYKIISLIFLVVLLSGTSCVTQRKCLKRFPPSVEVIKKDSIVYKEKVVIRDTTIFIKLPADTIKAEIEIPVTKILPPVTLETKYAKATASIDFLKGKIRLILVQKDAEIQLHIDSAKIETTYWKEKYQNDRIKEVVNVPFVPKYVKVFAYFGLVCLIFIIAYIVLKILKK